MNKKFVTTLLAVGSAGLGSYYYGGYKERQRILQNLPVYEMQQMELLHKVGVKERFNKSWKRDKLMIFYKLFSTLKNLGFPCLPPSPLLFPHP